jgi:hypothetical protein
VVAALLKLQFAGTSIVQPTGSNSSSGCGESASGDVKKFLTIHPCKDSAVASITMHKQGVSTQAAVSWVVMPSPALASQYKAMVDERFSGNPPGESDVFDGLCYSSGQSGETVWVGQVLPTGQLPVDREILQAVSPVELTVSYLKVHCVH